MRKLTTVFFASAFILQIPTFGHLARGDLMEHSWYFPNNGIPLKADNNAFKEGRDLTSVTEGTINADQGVHCIKTTQNKTT